MRLLFLVLPVFWFFGASCFANPEEEEEKFAVEVLVQKKDAIASIPKVVEQYATTFGCAFNMDEKNILKLNNESIESYLALFSLDLGCSGGSAMSRPYFVVLSFGGSYPKRMFINLEYSSPLQTMNDFPQHIINIFYKSNQLFYSALEYEPKDALCCPSRKVINKLIFENGKWKSILEK